MSFLRSATFSIRLLLLNSRTFSGHMISAVSIKHTQISCGTVKILYMVAIKLDNMNLASTVDSFNLFTLFRNSLSFLHTSLIRTIYQLYVFL